MSCFSLSEIDDSNEESEPDESSKQDARTKLGTPNELIPRNVSNHPDDSNILATTSNTTQDNEPEAQDISNSDSEGGKYRVINKKPNQECYLIFYFIETYVVY
jgi:hypothetical protein